MTIAVSMAVNQRKQRPKGSFPGAVNLERSLDAIRSEWRGSLDVPHDVAFSSLSHRGMVPTAGGTVELGCYRSLHPHGASKDTSRQIVRSQF